MRVVALSILALVVATTAHSAVHCSIHGSTHVVMSDGTSKYQQHSGGLFRAFATAYNGMRLEVQCEFTDRTAAPGASPQQVTSSSAVLSEPEMTSCRLRVYDVARGCGVDVRHDGTLNRGYGSIAGRAMPLAAMNQVPIDPHLGVKVIPLTGNALSVEANWNGTFIQVVLGEKYMQVHSAVVPSCVGLCGNCQGVQAPPMDISSMAAFVASQQVAPAQAIQPQALCGTSGLGLGASLSTGIPQLFPQQQQGAAMLGAYPYPAYSPPTLADLYYTAQFPTEAQLLMAFEQCSAGDMVRLQYDPIFNSFVEDCMYDKSLGVGFDAAAKSSMDAFVTFTESILRSARVAQVLAVSPYLVQVCAACIPVQWPDTIQTTQILTSITSSSSGSARAYERLASGGVTFPMRYASINNYAIDPFVQTLLASALSSASASSSSSSWNANIVMPSWSSASMLTLPSQLVSAPLVVDGQSSLSWNTMPLLGGGVCTTIDPSRLAQIEMLIQQYVEGGQATQLASLIQQGQYYSVCQALACGMGQRSPTMASFASYLPMSSVASICPISTVPSSMFYHSYGQYNGSNLPYNVYGQSTASLYDNYLQGATYAQQMLGMYGSYGSMSGSMYGQGISGNPYYGGGQAFPTGNGMWNAANGNVANGYLSGQAFGANSMSNGNVANGMWNGNAANGMWNGNVANGMWSGNVANGYFNGQAFGANSMWNGNVANGYLSGQAVGANGMWNGNVANGQAYGGNMFNGNLAASQYLGGQALNGNGFVAGSGVLNGAGQAGMMTGSSVLNGAYANANMLGTGSVNTLAGQFGGNFNGQFAGGAFSMNGQMSVTGGASQQLLNEAEMLAGAPAMSPVQGAMGTGGSTAERILAQQDTGNTVQALGQAPLSATLMA